MDSALRSSTHQYPCFSQEIIDNILDYLWNHGPTLSSCSIVCKAWLPCCRYHLFGDVNLTPEFAKFLTQGLGSISPYIRNVAIGSLSHKDEYDEVIFFLLKLDGIRGLSFEDWSWDLLGPTSKDSLLNTKAPIFDNLTKLHLRSLQFPYSSVLMALIDRFSILEDLSFDNVIWGLEDSIDRKPYNAQHLKRLHIGSSNVQPLLAWVSGGDDSAEGISTNLSVVELPDLSLSDLGLVGGIIRRLGSSLRHLEVGFLDNVDGGLPEIDLSYNGNLESLHLHHLNLYHFPNYDPDGDSPSSFSLAWLIPLLSTVSSPLNDLCLHVWISEETQLDAVNWPALCDILRDTIFRDQSVLRFKAFGLREGIDDLEGWLIARLAAWRASRHYLRIVYV